MLDIRPQNEKIIKSIQDIAIILTGASEFVCKKRMLKRFSRTIEESLRKLEDNVAYLKNQFQGNFPDELNPDSSLSTIRDLAVMLKEDNADIEEICRSGELGAKLDVGVTEIRSSMKNIFDALSEGTPRYTIVDRFTEYGGRIKLFLLRISRLVSKTGRAQIERVKEARERAARDKEATKRVAREQAAREQAAREQEAREQEAREKAAREQEAKEQEAREQAAREQAAREQAIREEVAREQAAREQEAKEQAAREQAAREQEAKEQEAREKAAREQA
ncbi:MAG: hypothetical protein ACQEQO_09450, partial [Thermodesulfobacteriota bacterium]